MQGFAGRVHDGAMTQAPPREPGAPPRVLRRSSQGRFLLGICAGLGRHTGIDPVVFRVAFAVLIENAGYGGVAAAPAAGEIVTAAAASGLLK